MKKLIYLLLLCPLLVVSQPGTELIFEIGTLTVSPANVKQVEAAMGAHNKKYHASGASGVRVYVVQTGSEAGSYKWVMGPAPWSSLDNRPQDEAHNTDWQDNVARHLGESGNTEYIRFDPKLSRFPKDFNADKLFIRYIDVARGKMKEVNEILKQIHRVYAEKIPGETFGIYYNEIPSTSSGRDITVTSFFNSYSWMAQDDNFDAKYDEIFGKGKAAKMWTAWQAATVGMESEIWEYREDLSGLPPMIKVAERQ